METRPLTSNSDTGLQTLDTGLPFGNKRVTFIGIEACIETR
jgi:hypothetical protein